MSDSMDACWSAPISKRLVALVVMAPVLLLSGCGAVIPRVTPTFVATMQHFDATVDAERLAQIRTLYVNRCSSCHSLTDPLAYTVEEWPDWMAKMRKKAKLNPAQEQDLIHFVLAVHALPPEPETTTK